MVLRTKPLSLTFEVTRCKGVGPATASRLERLDITTAGDLVSHFPRAYLDRRRILSIASVRASEPAVIEGQVSRVRSFRPSRRLHITKCTITDRTGSLDAVWFNQRYLAKTLSETQRVILSGRVVLRAGLQMENPDIEPVSDRKRGSLHTMGLIPVYPLTEGLGQKKLRRLIWDALQDSLAGISENLPRWMLDKWGLPPRDEALRAMHFPRSEREAARARERFAFEEFLALQLSIQSAAAADFQGGIAHLAPASLTTQFDSRVPFSLTAAQRRAVEEIFRRMESPRRMNVLLQGDVGSGKTVVAAYSILKAIENGKQAALMAPTEILAEQHFANLRELFDGLNVETALLIGSLPAPQKTRFLRLLESGRPCLAVGTHALIGAGVEIPNASLIIIDEQHRFGVNQRARLGTKGITPDLIVMTATPIPRTLALALYGGFTTLPIDELPQGRRRTLTYHVREPDRPRTFAFVREQIAAGRQAFVVCPEIGAQTDPEDAGATTASKAHRIYRRAFPEFSVGLMHGRLPMEEREKTFLRFRRNEIQILIATTIIEVGLDVPNASVMVVESPDRFGLTQLHQLRGRVGRGDHDSYCFLLGEPSTAGAVRRIEIMTASSDGFEIAEQDLLLRGPGDFLGTAQSGAPPLRVGHLARDARLLERARRVAAETLRADPRLETTQNQPLRLLLGASAPDAVHL